MVRKRPASRAQPLIPHTLCLAGRRFVSIGVSLLCSTIEGWCGALMVDGAEEAWLAASAEAAAADSLEAPLLSNDSLAGGAGAGGRSSGVAASASGTAGKGAVSGCSTGAGAAKGKEGAGEGKDKDKDGKEKEKEKKVPLNKKTIGQLLAMSTPDWWVVS